MLDRGSADQIARFQEAHPESHIALGILFARAGAFEPAEEELKLIAATDADYALAQKLLRSIEEMRNRGQ